MEDCYTDLYFYNKRVEGKSTLTYTGKFVDFYADEVTAYFRNENEGLCEKMSAWYETQKAGKNEDEIDKIEGQKRAAFRNAMRKSMRVVSADWLQGAKAK